MLMLDAIVIAVVVIAAIALGLVVANIRSWPRERKTWMPGLNADEHRRIHDAKPKRDYRTATCPICGKYDASKPFISYAIDCHRADCNEL